MEAVFMIQWEAKPCGYLWPELPPWGRLHVLGLYCCLRPCWYLALSTCCWWGPYPDSWYCCIQGPSWCPLSMLALKVMQMSTICAAAWCLVDGYGLGYHPDSVGVLHRYCHWRSFSTWLSVFPAGTTVLLLTIKAKKASVTVLMTADSLIKEETEGFCDRCLCLCPQSGEKITV